MRLALRSLLQAGVLVCAVFLAAHPGGAGTLDASWIAPTTKDDGTPLTNLDSYRIYYRTTLPTSCPSEPPFLVVPAPSATPGPGETVGATLTGLTTGTTYFAAVTALDTGGGESDCSNVGSAAARIDFAVSPAGTPDFGTVTVGNPANRTFTVTNIAGGTVSGSVAASGPFTVVSGGSFNLVELNASATVTVRFMPTLAATVSSSVTFTANGGTI